MVEAKDFEVVDISSFLAESDAKLPFSFIFGQMFCFWGVRVSAIFFIFLQSFQAETFCCSFEALDFLRRQT